MSKSNITITLHVPDNATSRDARGVYPDDVVALVCVDGRPVGREHIALDHAHGEVLRALVDHAPALLEECDRRERRSRARLATHDLPTLDDVGVDLSEEPGADD